MSHLVKWPDVLQDSRYNELQARFDGMSLQEAVNEIAIRAHTQEIMICRHICWGNRGRGIGIFFTCEFFLHPNFFLPIPFFFTDPKIFITLNFDLVLERLMYLLLDFKSAKTKFCGVLFSVRNQFVQSDL